MCLCVRVIQCCRSHHTDDIFRLTLIVIHCNAHYSFVIYNRELYTKRNERFMRHIKRFIIMNKTFKWKCASQIMAHNKNIFREIIILDISMIIRGDMCGWNRDEIRMNGTIQKNINWIEHFPLAMWVCLYACFCVCMCVSDAP